MQKHVNLVDLVKSFPTNIYLQNLASIQKRTSPVKFAHLAEKSGKGSISNLSTKRSTPQRAARLPAQRPARPAAAGTPWPFVATHSATRAGQRLPCAPRIPRAPRIAAR